MTKAAFCGSFDPVTLGHLDLIERAAAVFETVFVFVSVNSSKQEAFSTQQKIQWIEQACSHLKNVEVAAAEGLAADACRQAGARVLIRGVRNEQDFGYEANMCFMNETIAPDLETLVMFCRPEYAFISSSNIREMLKYNQSIEKWVPAVVFQSLQPHLYMKRKDTYENLD